MHLFKGAYPKKGGFETAISNAYLTCDEVIDIFKEAKVQVNRQPLKKSDVQVVHRLQNEKTVICKVVNRKFVKEALYNGINLKGTKRYGEKHPVYINDSFCPEFTYLNYCVRKAQKRGAILRYKIRNGVTFAQKSIESKFLLMGHVKDLENLSIPLLPRYE